MDYLNNIEKVVNQLKSDGAFLTVKHGDLANTMTIGWGFIGIMWTKPYFIVAVRPQRYTFGIIEKADSFTVSVPFETMKKELLVCGTKSGADINKQEVVKFIDGKTVKSPVIDGCNAYYECAIHYSDELNKGSLEQSILQKFYKDDYHKFYFGEIADFYIK